MKNARIFPANINDTDKLVYDQESFAEVKIVDKLIN